MALTQISTAGVKDDAISAGKIPANALGSSEIADDAVDQGAIADEAVDEASLQISNAGYNGQFLQKQSGNTGGLTWAAANEYTHPNHSGEVTSSADGAQTIATNVVDEDNLKISNAGTNGQFLQKQSGNTGGLTWADVTIPPAGNTVDLVADGAIAAGKPVIITTAGKAKQAGQTVTESTSQSSSPVKGNNGIQMNLNDNTNKFNTTVFSETSDFGCNFFSDAGNDQTLEGRIWNKHASTGDANIPAAANTDIIPTTDIYYQISSCWESTNNKFIIVAKKDADEKNYMTWVTVGSDSNSGITASGNVTEIDGGSTPKGSYPKCCDCGSGRVATVSNVNWSAQNIYRPIVKMFVWNSSSSNYDTGQVEWVTSDGDSSNSAEDAHLAYHAAEDKLIVVWHTEANKVGCKIGTISGSGTSMDVSFGSEVEVAAGAELPKVAVDVNTGKVVVTYVYTSSNDIYSKVGTISGTSISFGSEVEIDAHGDANERGNFRPELIYLKHLKKVLYAWVANESSTYYTYTKTGTVSGTSISWANKYTHWSDGVGIRGLTMCDINDSGTNKVVLGGRNDNWGDRGAFKTIALTSAVTNVTAKNIIGWANSAISDTATGTVNLQGSVATGQSGLTPGEVYFVQPGGTLGSSVNGTQANLLAIASDKGIVNTRTAWT